MKCPVCVETDLLLSERQGVEIDYCPKCRGVWLDRGELDKIIAASTQQQYAPSPPPSQSQYQQYQYSEHPHDKHHEKEHHHKKKSLLGELFDF